MLGKSDKTEARKGVPNLHFAVFTTGGNELTIRRVIHGVEAIQVALLFKHIGLGLPLPHKQLAQLGGAYR